MRGGGGCDGGCCVEGVRESSPGVLHCMALLRSMLDWVMVRSRAAMPARTVAVADMDVWLWNKACSEAERAAVWRKKNIFKIDV